MVVNLWKDVGGYHFPKYKLQLHLGEIMVLHQVCADHSGVRFHQAHLSSQISSKDAPFEDYQNKFCHHHLGAQELGNVARPKVKCFIIHPSIIEPFIHFD